MENVCEEDLTEFTEMAPGFIGGVIVVTFVCMLTAQKDAGGGMPVIPALGEQENLEFIASLCYIV